MRALRRLLDGLYDAAAWLAALALVGLLAMVLVGIASRLVHVHVPGTDAYAGYLMAACGFLALAHTLKHGAHIRVTLVVDALAGRARRAIERWALAAASLLALLLAVYSVRLAWQSHAYGDVSTANDATPLWLPQLAMAFGSVVFAIAFVDELVLELRGLRAAPEAGEALPTE